MGIGDTLSKEVRAWGTLAIVIVIVSVVLLKFKNVSGVTSDLNTTIDTFVTALSEPKNWVIIAIIALIGFAILKYFQKKN
ncbi:MAG TPA: hypothetical protein PLG47_05230 [Candidatus Dojkabacteria bacterium]|nr:hypothetical protein [Candidatus Dojkabacteria bacterium]